MLSLVRYTLLAHAITASANSVRGVSEAQQHLYKPLESDSSKWACLSDPSIILNYSQINDDYCDCPDGSDEPGTSACGSLSRFYCPNEGFAARYVSGYKVDDGVCDCCDCSDESTDKPFSDYSCLQLRDQYDALVIHENSRHERGAHALRDMERKFGADILEDTADDSETTLKQLKADYEVHADQYKACVTNLASTKELYEQKLQRENPLMLRMEQIDIPGISYSISNIFTQAESYSETYHELIDIMNALEETYNKNLNDDVVNRNVQNFNEFMQNNKAEGTVSASFDRTQRDQIEEYLTEELPSMILKGTTHLPPAAIEGKFSMAKALVKVKINYCEKMHNTLKSLSDIMNDVSANYNVNFQDSGVKNAVISYRNFIAKNSKAFEPFKVSYGVLKRLEEVGGLVKAASSELLTPAWKEKTSFMSVFRNLASNLESAFGNKEQGLEALKSKVVILQEKCAALRKDYRSKAQQLEQLRKETPQDKVNNGENAKNRRLKTLLTKIPLICIEQKIDSYIYQICFNSEDGVIVQREDKPGGKEVLIGRFDTFGVDPRAASDRYTDELRIDYSESDLIAHLENDLTDYEVELLIGNLPQINSGLYLQYSRGDMCWNGPARSAQVFFKCDDRFKINGVQETTRCRYAFDVSGPLGCSTEYTFTAPAWSQDR
ncbi:LAME_0D08922g1_1 [Lachancea meyersii CBS 8951]|uniref:Glucosidase 2 subunit beta n=1 Tax=Lachancea meyersii CBS 8951 TaxID=1266667 RepID=A0A1G4JBC2_9SACH|nr:LAME_0D08922g1_1 [Lachancea meyersii CBS 8951]